MLGNGVIAPSGFQLGVLAAAAGLAGLAYCWTYRYAPAIRLGAGYSVDMEATRRQKRSRKLDASDTAGSLEQNPNSAESDAESEGEAFPLVQLTEQVVFLDVCKFLPAKSIARLKAVCRDVRDSLNTDDAVSWVVESRDWRSLERIHRVGDLPLELPAGDWSLERLHLAENPPRFRALNFDFASHTLSRDGPNGTILCLEEIAQLMHTHKGIRLRVTGYAQPDAPRFIARRLSAERAAMAVLYLACRLLGIAVSNWNIDAVRALIIRSDHRGGGGMAAHRSQQEELHAYGFVFPIPRLFAYDSDSDEDESEEEEVEEEDGDDEGGRADDLGDNDDNNEDVQGAGRRRVEVPVGWSLKGCPSTGGRLCELSELRVTWVGCDEMRLRLLDVLSRFEQVAAGGSTPINTNWELEDEESDLSAERRVEFTLIDI